MKNPSKNLGSEWLSIGDLMSVLLLLMVLVVIVSLFRMGAVKVEYEKVIEENDVLDSLVTDYEDSKIKILTSISDKLNEAGVSHVFDDKVGSISISDSLLFVYGKAEFLSNGKDALRKLIPIINEVMYMNDMARSEIIGLEITGFASEYRHGDDSYMKDNMDLSLNRADSVWAFIMLVNGLLEEEDFFKKIKVVGRGSYLANSYLDIPTDRRVDFIFQFKGPIDGIKKIINSKSYADKEVANNQKIKSEYGYVVLATFDQINKHKAIKESNNLGKYDCNLYLFNNLYIVAVGPFDHVKAKVKKEKLSAIKKDCYIVFANKILAPFELLGDEKGINNNDNIPIKRIQTKLQNNRKDTSKFVFPNVNH